MKQHLQVLLTILSLIAITFVVVTCMDTVGEVLEMVNTQRAMKAHGGTTDARANEVPTPVSFGGLENREEDIAKPSLIFVVTK